MTRTNNIPTHQAAKTRRQDEAKARQAIYDNLSDDEKMAQVASRLGSTPEDLIAANAEDSVHYRLPREISRIHTRRTIQEAKSK